MASNVELGGESFEDSSPLSTLQDEPQVSFAPRREHAEQFAIDADLAYWRQKLGGKLPVLDLPADRPRPPVQTGNGATVPVALSADIREGLQAVAAREGVAVHTVLLAAFKALLHRWSGQEDIITGTALDGRTEDDADFVGPLANVLALRTAICGEMPFRELLRRVAETMEGAYAHRYCPFEQVIETLQVECALGRSPVFQVMFLFQHGARTLHTGTAKCDLTLSLEKATLSGQLEFNADVFHRATIERFWGHYETLLAGIIESCETPVAKLPLLTPAEREQLLVTWNTTEMPYRRDRCVHELFEEQAQRTPDQVAAVFEDEELSYRELNRRANAVATHLKSLGVGPEGRVGICLHRSMEILVGLLGILKSGAAYVPLDPAYPKERLAMMLEDAQVDALLTDQTQRFESSGAKIVLIETLSSKAIDENPVSRATPEDLAYVIYTSGSTGRPKGVMIRHRNVVNFFAGMDAVLGTTPGVWLAVTSICFDISVLELLWTVTRGFKVVIQSDQGGLRANAAAAPGINGQTRRYEIPEQIRRLGITHFQCTPSLMGMLLQEKGAREAMASVNTVLLGGEALSAALVQQLEGTQRIINMYGPTETTVWSTSEVIERGAPITIGRPMANTTIYILDRFQQPTPVGVPGELHIGGEGVVRGYWNRPELTAERFVPNPFATQPGETMYRTGDLARYRADGKIEYLGRLDHQVKLRGFRIELGEIEAALRHVAGVREAVVVVRELNADDKRLAAYLVADKPVEAAQLRRALREKLPDYMVPALFTFLPKLPLTPNGKIDRKALPDPGGAVPVSTDIEPAVAEVEDRQAIERKQAGKYWAEQFATIPPELELPYDTSWAEGFRTAEVHRQVDAELTQRLKQFSQEHRVTLFTTLLSGYAILLHRLSGQEDFVIGVPASDDPTKFLPIRVQVDGKSAIGEHLEQIASKLDEAYHNQSFTFEMLLQRLGLPRNANRTPLMSASFGLCEGVAVAFDFRERDGQFGVNCTYNAELFRAQTITRWLGHFVTLLENMVADAAQAVSAVRVLSAAEWQQIVVDWNQTALAFPQHMQMHVLFEAQAERTPDAVAAVVGQQAITYRELNERANQLAHHLRSLGVGPEVFVGLCVARSFSLLVGALGILKAGGAYVPLDWTYPPERVRFMLEDTQAPVVVTQDNLRQFVPPTDARMVCLDTEMGQIGTQPTSNPAPIGHSGNLAYVMYTSGSTGRAKGVALEHRGAVSFIHWAREAFSGEELKAVLASTSICFDLSIFEIFVPLSWGGTVVLADNAVNLPANSSITLINTVPSAIKDLLKAGTIPPSVRVVNLAGEKLATQVVEQLYAQPHIRKVYDLYGPSEATTYATWTLRTANGPAVIGRPLANTQVYIVDSHLQPCPIGVAGEIYIGGDCLARGYINRPELTAERFVANPFSAVAEGRLYRTGDLGRYLPDGNIEFIGRRDHQVKIRGYRIELGEIEAVLGQHPGVQECVAVVREDAPEQKQIVAYIVPARGAKLEGAEVRPFVRQRLPDYMVPAVFVTLPALPLMPNGKVNRGGLPAPAPAITLREEGEAVQSATAVEEALMEIWREVIGVEKVGLHDDFFDLGGHSVLVAQITSRVRQVFEVDLSMRHLFGAPTVAALARVVEGLLEEQIQALSEEELQQLTAGASKGGA